MLHRKNYNLNLGTVITAAMALLIIVGVFWTPYDPDAQNASIKMAAPSFQHLLGTDNFGRDIFSRVVKGAGTTMFISIITVAIGVGAGILLGGLTGYFGGWLDEVFMRINDVVTAFPSVLLALVILSILGPGKPNVIIALGLLFIPSFTRIVRGEFVKCRELDYVKNARLMGVSHTRIVFVHILPNITRVLLSSTAIGFNNAVLAEASMSFLGIGVQPPDASLGRMLAESQSYLFSAPWYALSTGFAVVLLILGFGLLSEGLGRSGYAGCS